MRESCEMKLYTLCFPGFLMEFLKEMAAYHQAKETYDVGTQTSPVFSSKDSLGNYRLLSEFQFFCFLTE